MTRPVAPAAMRPARLAPLATLPVFLDLAGKRAVVAGDGAPAAWKAELMAAAGAQVSVYAADPEPELLALADAYPHTIALVPRSWSADDLDGAAVAIGDLADTEEAARFAAAARTRGVLVNVIDRPAFCGFRFGAIVNRSPVVVGIATAGAAPILAQAIRRRIEAVLPAALGAWGEAAKRFRDRVAARLPGRAERRLFWERFVDKAFAADAREAAADGLERLARSVGGGRGGVPETVGRVVLVGAGPGDPELLTLRAMRELQAADVIVHDRLVTPEVLELGRREAQRIAVGKEGHGPACRQEDINALIVSLARKGRRVVRLKGGDPAIFGRAGEEVAACHAAGIAVAVAPGVTAASAAAAALGLSLTHRAVARRVQFVTGHDRYGLLPPDLDLAALADDKATTCIYMGRRTAAELARRLVAQGLPPSTPAVAMANVSRPGAQALRATLGEVAAGIDLPGDGPLMLLVGAALAEADASEAETAAALRVLAA